MTKLWRGLNRWLSGQGHALTLQRTSIGNSQPTLSPNPGDANPSSAPSPHKHCMHIWVNKYTRTHDLNLKTLLKYPFCGWRDDWAVQRACWSCRRPEFDSQHPHPVAHNCVWQSNLRGSEILSTSMGSCTHGMNIINAHRRTHIHINGKSPRKSKTKQNKTSSPLLAACLVHWWVTDL